MKAKLEFILPEEETEFEEACAGSKWHSVVDEILNHLRSKMKYEELSEEVYKELEMIRILIYDEIESLGLTT